MHRSFLNFDRCAQKFWLICRLTDRPVFLYSIPWNSFIPVGGTASCTVLHDPHPFQKTGEQTMKQHKISRRNVLCAAGLQPEKFYESVGFSAVAQ
jgi:hypothetical protein